MEFKITDNSDIVLAALEKQIEKALEECGNTAVSHAKQNIERAARVDQGTMINSVTHQVEMGESAVYVGTNVEHAIFNELGTGIYTDGGRETPWSYQDGKGNWHTTRGMQPIHFIRNSISEHIPQYEGIIKKNLKSD